MNWAAGDDGDGDWTGADRDTACVGNDAVSRGRRRRASGVGGGGCHGNMAAHSVRTTERAGYRPCCLRGSVRCGEQHRQNRSERRGRAVCPAAASTRARAPTITDTGTVGPHSWGGRRTPAALRAELTLRRSRGGSGRLLQAVNGFKVVRATHYPMRKGVHTRTRAHTNARARRLGSNT